MRFIVGKAMNMLTARLSRGSIIIQPVVEMMIPEMTTLIDTRASVAAWRYAALMLMSSPRPFIRSHAVSPFMSIARDETAMTAVALIS